MNPSRYDVLIVGAGVAGIAAAERLVASGLHVLILEARDRIGGRAWTDYTLGPDRPLELGAQMVHGRSVVTHDWIQEAGLSVRPMPLMQKGRFVLARKVSRMPWMALPFHPVFGSRAVIQAGLTVPRRLSRFAGVDRSLARWMDEAEVSPAVRSLVNLLYAHVSAADPDTIGVKGPAEEQRNASEPFGYANYQLREGYSELIRRSAEPLLSSIRLGVVVRRIECHDATVRVLADRRSDRQPLEWAASRVLVTVPLSVLRAGEIAFDPPLPAEKQRAIDQIAMGDAMTFHFWSDDHVLRERWGDFSMIWGDGATSFLRPRVGLGESREIFTAFTVGQEARRRASLDEERLREVTLAELESILPVGSRIGVIAGSLGHRWPVDPFARGAYSYLPPGVGVAERRALAAPVGGQLFFGGEATNYAGEAGTVHGAIETGYRAADEMLNARVRGPLTLTE